MTNDPETKTPARANAASQQSSSASSQPLPNLLRSPTAMPPAQSAGRYVDTNGRDEFDHHVLSHRADLESLDNQIASLDRTIELEQQKLRETKEALESSYRTRSRLLHLRTAMLKFVLELEAREIE